MAHTLLNATRLVSALILISTSIRVRSRRTRAEFSEGRLLMLGYAFEQLPK